MSDNNYPHIEDTPMVAEEPVTSKNLSYVFTPLPAVDEETVDLETAREMNLKAVREEYAKP